MFWSKRRPSRPGDPSSASQQPEQHQQPQKRVSPIPSSSSSTITASLPAPPTTPSTPSAALSQSPASSRFPLAPLHPQISASTSVSFSPSSTPPAARVVVSGTLETDSHRQGKGGKISLAMKDSNSQNHNASSSSSPPRPGPSNPRRAPEAAPPRPTFQPTWTQGLPATEPSLYQELSSFQFGAPAIPSSSSPPPPPPNSHASHGLGDDDDLVSPLTVNDVTPRPSVVSTGTSDLPISYRSHPPNEHTALDSDTLHQPHLVYTAHDKSSVHSHAYGEAPLYTTSSHPSQSPSPPPGTSASHLQALNQYAPRHRSSSPPVGGRRPRDTKTHSMLGESSTVDSASVSGFMSSSSSASASVTSLTSASNSMSPDDDLSSTVGSSRGGAHHDRDIEFSSEEEYEYDDDDGYEYDDHNIEVSSAYWDEGHGDRPDSFYYFGGGGSAVGMGSGLSLASMPRRGSVPMAIPGAPDTTSAGPNAASPRDREGSMATLRRPSRSVDDDLRSFTFGAPSRHTGAVPQSDPLTRGEWSAMESRQEQMRNVGPLDSGDVVTPTMASSSRTASSSTAGASGGDITSLGFDSDWSDLRGGITSLTASDIAGLVDPNTKVVATRRPSGGLGLSLFSSGSTSPGPNSAGATGRTRMGSWWSILSTRRQSEATVTDDTFTRNVRRWDGAYGSRRRDWTFRREKGAPGEKLGTTMERTESATGSNQKANASHDGEKERDREKRKAPKGMTVGTSEIWSNELVGRFKVDRRAARPLDPSKPPQQRLNFIHFQGSDSQVRTIRPGPPVTVHKHSKAIAFSISRQHAKPRIRPRDSPSSGPAQRGAPIREATVPRSSMIMLAPKRVQEQYTNTTTTRRLDTHGLLEDHVLGLRREKERRERDLERERERQRRAEGTSETPTTRSTSSVNSLSNGRELYPTPPPASAPSLHTYPPPPPHELRKHASSKSLRSSVNPDSIPASAPNALLERVSRSTARRIRRDPYDFDDPDEDEAPTRTPHAETYATIDPAQVEHMRLLQGRLDSDQPSRSLLRRFLGLSTAVSAGAPLSASIDGSFKAPWLTMAPRAKQEEHERVVANLNESFIDVGLLPSRPAHKSKAGGNPQKQKQIKQKHATGANGSNSNIFEQVPPDSLYMLLPLWPGETDPMSERLPSEPKKPHIPLEDRQYLLVYYVADEVKHQEHESWSKSEADSRVPKKARSPTSSVEAAGRRADDRSILLSAFHVSARLVGYDELRTSGMRVPDEGLSVTGPMSEAVKTMPSPSLREQHHQDFIIAMCHSRDAGMEFVQEGLVKMGLCLVVSPQPRESAVPPDETEEMEEPDVVLSPIGRAVVEMAWVGSMALTSFGPTV